MAPYCVAWVLGLYSVGVSPINAALAQVRYMPSPDWVGDVVVWVRANDYGFSGVGGAMQSVAQVHLRESGK